MSNILSTCILCENPYPYWCEECQSEATIVVENTTKTYIGSGEDFSIEFYEGVECLNP
jgi:hypothetical protein